MLDLISDLFELVFWLLLIVAVWKYDIFDRLPYWLQITLYGSIGLSGISGLISKWL